MQLKEVFCASPRWCMAQEVETDDVCRRRAAGWMRRRGRMHLAGDPSIFMVIWSRKGGVLGVDLRWDDAAAGLGRLKAFSRGCESRLVWCWAEGKSANNNVSHMKGWRVWMEAGLCGSLMWCVLCSESLRWYYYGILAERQNMIAGIGGYLKCFSHQFTPLLSFLLRFVFLLY